MTDDEYLDKLRVMGLTRSLTSLPIADHIIRVLKSFDDHPDVWNAVTLRGTTKIRYFDQQDAALRIINSTGRSFLLSCHSGILAGINVSDYKHAHSAILGLIAYDYYEAFLDYTPDEILKLMEIKHAGAALFLPAVIAFQHIANLPAA